MASLAQLQADVASYLNRQDILTNGVMPGWVAAVETELAETLRARCQVASAIQPIDAAYIALPSDFATMESIRDATTGELLHLVDEWMDTGHRNISPLAGNRTTRSLRSAALQCGL